MSDPGDEGANTPRDGELLLYDFFKHLTSLSILLLGGVLIMAEPANGKDVHAEVMLPILICLAFGGMLAFSGSSEIVRARVTGTPVRPSLKWHRLAAPGLLGIGVGMFLVMFVDRLG